MKIVIMVIASPGFEYECMRHVWLMHWQHASRWLGPDAELWFLHGQGDHGKSASPRVSDHDRFYADVDESLIPGILDKTMMAFRDALDAGADVVVRTNLSSFYMWKRLADFLRDTFGEPKPSAADKCTLPGVADKCTLPGVAGFSPDRSHFSGCNMILSRATVQWLVDRDADLDRTLIDDVAISRLLMKHSPVPHRWISRLDIADRVLHNAPRGLAEVFHVRVKSARRIDDARTMYDLMLRHRDHPDFLI